MTKLLIVEDSATQAAELTLLLESRGFGSLSRPMVFPD